MDLRVLSEGRTMLIVRGAIGFLIGVFASNLTGLSGSAMVTLFGVWALLEGAALVRQAYQPNGRPGPVQPARLLLVLGGVGLLVGVVTMFGFGLSATVGTWLLAAWITSRAVFEVGAGLTAVARRAKVLFVISALLDLALAALFVTHTNGNIENLLLVGGGIAALWGMAYLVIGLGTVRVRAFTADGPRMLARR